MTNAHVIKLNEKGPKNMNKLALSFKKKKLTSAYCLLIGGINL